MAPTARLRLHVVPRARRAGVVGRAVTIVSGHGAREKTVELTGADRDRVDAALESTGRERER